MCELISEFDEFFLLTRLENYEGTPNFFRGSEFRTKLYLRSLLNLTICANNFESDMKIRLMNIVL